MNKLLNKSAFLTFGLFAVLMFSSAVFAQTKSEILIVADQKADCRGVALIKCLQIKNPQDERWTLFHQNIENFNYVEGYTYVLRVKVETVKNPPADASNLKYRLRKILNREKTGDENSENDSSRLTAKAWQLMAIDGEKVNADKSFINFDTNKKSVGGNGGCNGFGGNLSVNGSEIKMTEIISTQMFCENASEVENKFLRNLERAMKYQITGDKLVLFAGEKIILEFTAKN